MKTKSLIMCVMVLLIAFTVVFTTACPLDTCDCDESCTGDCDCNNCPCEPTTIPAAPGNVVINRSGSNATEFKYSVGAVHGATGYKTKTVGGSEVGSFTGVNGTVNSGVNTAGITELHAFATNSAGDSTGHAKVPGMVKYANNNTGLAQAYTDWFTFLQNTMMAARLAGISYAYLGFGSDVSFVNFRNAVDTIVSDGITAGDVEALKSLHGERARTTTEKLLEPINWAMIEGMLTSAPDSVKNDVNETLPRIWFNANELMGPGAARNNLDSIMKQRLQDAGYTSLAAGTGWIN